MDNVTRRRSERCPLLVTTVALVLGGSSLKKLYKGSVHCPTGGSERGVPVPEGEGHGGIGGKEEMPTEQPNNLLVN